MHVAPYIPTNPDSQLAPLPLRMCAPWSLATHHQQVSGRPHGWLHSGNKEAHHVSIEPQLT